MKIIDTHSHIYSEEFDNDMSDIITRAKEIGVEKILLPNIDVESITRLNKLSDTYPDFCLPMMGLHPTSVDEEWENNLEIIKKSLSDRKYVAIGEIGIDLYWGKTFEKEQIQVFEEQLHWSIEYDLPVVVHSREAICACIDSIKKIGASKLRGVFHSFGGSEEELSEILKLKNFLIGINGVVTFKNSTLPTILQKAELSHILIETDAPYLSPVPYRGKRNEPSYTAYIVNKLAEIYNITPSEVGEITSENATSLFKL